MEKDLGKNWPTLVETCTNRFVVLKPAQIRSILIRAALEFFFFFYELAPGIPFWLWMWRYPLYPHEHRNEAQEL